MTGIVEMDETYIGGNAIRRFQRALTVKLPKEMVLAIRDARRNVGRPIERSVGC
jgi:hypothetical protein